MSKRERPEQIVIDGQSYKVCVGLINTKFPDGSPRNITLIAEDATIELAGGEEFVVGYIPDIVWTGDGR